MSLRACFVSTVAALVLAACSDPEVTPPAEPTKSPTQPPTPMAPRLVPPPPGFPDMSDYAAADGHAYYASGPYYGGITFRTSDGQFCNYNAMNTIDKPGVTVFTCTGPRPDRGPGLWTEEVRTNRAAIIEPGTDNYQGRAVLGLPARHTVAWEDIVCGTDGEGTTACRVGEHGFVLTPTETKLF